MNLADISPRRLQLLRLREALTMFLRTFRSFALPTEKPTGCYKDAWIWFCTLLQSIQRTRTRPLQGFRLAQRSDLNLRAFLLHSLSTSLKYGSSAACFGAEGTSAEAVIYTVGDIWKSGVPAGKESFCICPLDQLATPLPVPCRSNNIVSHKRNMSHGEWSTEEFD